VFVHTVIAVAVCSSRFFVTGISFHTIRRIYESKMSNALMQQFVAGLKSRNAETRSKAARDLYHYVSTEYTVIFFFSYLQKWFTRQIFQNCHVLS